jgi:myo-inositol-1(or 4)-monophosphatase
MGQELDLSTFLRSRLTMVSTLAALNAGEMARKGFGTEITFEMKEGRHNLVTIWDKKIEQSIIEFISSHFPDHSFLAEESGLSGENQEGIQWIIDPIDGTVNFAHKIPIFSISIAATFQNTVLSGVIFAPLLDELFIAEKENGAYLNGQKLRVTETAILDSAILGTGFPYNVYENPLKCLDLFSHFVTMGIPIRRLGSAALDLAYVAAGRLDAFWEVSLRPWDYAAAKLILEEAGGIFTDFEGNPYVEMKEGPIIASNSVLHEQMVHNIHTVVPASGERGNFPR